MKVTKYPQSCIVIEKDGKRLVIDPGSFVSQLSRPDDLKPVDGILLTHEHADHVDPELIKLLLEGTDNVPVVGNQSTAQLLNDLVTNMVADQEELEIAGFRITARELPHCDMPDGSPGPQNTGYVIDGVFFHPGDGIKIDGLSVATTAAPIAGPDVSPRDAFDLAKSVNCKVMIPIHYDYFKEDTSTIVAAARATNMPFEVRPLQNGESTEI